MEQKEKIVYRFYQEGDDEQLSRFHAEVFNVQRPPSYFKWKYIENPDHHSAMALAVKEGKIIGQIGTVPMRLKIKADELLAAQVQDIVIAENYRRGGTFFRLERIARDAVQKETGVEFAFSIKSTYKIATRLLGFRGVSPIYRMVKILNIAPYLEARAKSAALVKLGAPIGNTGLKLLDLFKYGVGDSSIQVERVERFDERFDRLWQQCKSQFEIMVARTSAYLNWRYCDHPSLTYSVYAALQNGSLKGYIVLQTRRKGEASGTVVDIDVETTRGFITDILAEPGPDHEKTLEALLLKAITLFRDEGADVVACWVLKHMELRETLRRLGFLERETPHDLMVRASDPDHYPEDYLAESARWYITRGDSDYE
jgi:hypothetical protein